MGLFDWLTGSKAPPAGVARQPVAQLRDALLAINRDTAPFVIRDGAPEQVDLLAEWKIVEAQWREIFAKAGISRVFKVLMRFDEAKGEVRSVDQEWQVDWRAGVPGLSLSAEAFRGQKWELSTGAAYAFDEHSSFGKVYSYRFAARELKEPLRNAALAAGWGWHGVSFGKL